MYKLFLTIRYLRKARIAYLAIGAVTLCVAMVLTVLSVMGGWLDQVKRSARGMLGDVVIENYSQAGFPLYEEFIAEVSKWPEVVRATPVVYSYGIVRFPDWNGRNETVRIVGIRLNEVFEVNAFKRSLYYEKFFPGTTTLKEQQKPLAGLDPNREPTPTKNGDGLLPPIALPEPYDSAYRATCAEHLKRTGKPLVDPDSVPDSLNELFAENGVPILPGIWDAAHGDTREDRGPELAGPTLPGMILGRDLVATRESDGRYRRFIAKGELVDLTMWEVSASGFVDVRPLKKRFLAVDDSRTGIYDIDSKHVYVDFDMLQAFTGMGGDAERVDLDGNPTGQKVPKRCSQIQMKLADGVDGAALCVRLKKEYDRLANANADRLSFTERKQIDAIRVKTWQESQAQVIGPVEKERMLVTILFGIISLVAVVLILCILYMIVLQKTRDIGIIKAIGGSSGGVASVWVLYGAAVGLVGAVLGTIIGVSFVWNINEVQDWLIWQFGFRVWDMSVYAFDSIPREVNPVEATVVAVSAVLASTVGSLAAAWRAGRMEPVEAIRHE
ncbi:MAG: ABC transporter permease [Phycisphaerales bacterium]|nr:ABC transporter permease [Phycisphaerales bacterium]